MKLKREKPDDAELRELVSQGLSDKSIGTHFGVGVWLIRKWRRDIGLEKAVGCPVGFKHSEEVKKRRPHLIGDKNPFYGKKHSDETRKRMSDNHADITGDNNPYRNSLLADSSKRDAARERSRNMWANRDHEWRKAWAETLSARAIQNPVSRIGRNHKSGRHLSPKIDSESQSIWYRSSWELALAQKLDQCIDVASYKYEHLHIKFTTANGETRWTYTDFLVTLVSGRQVMMEVKPLSICYLKQDRLAAQLKWCLDSSVQYAIVDKSIILDQFSSLIDASLEGWLNAGKYDGRGPLTPALSSEIIRSWESHRETNQGH